MARNFHEIACPRCGWATQIPVLESRRDEPSRLDGDPPDECPDCGADLRDVAGEDVGPIGPDPDADYDRGR